MSRHFAAFNAQKKDLKEDMKKVLFFINAFVTFVC
jgi:hypothetical protein